MTHGNSPERPKHCLHAHRHSSPHFLQVRFARPAALTALCAPWRRFGADKVLRRRRELHQHHGRGPRRDPVVRRKTLRARSLSICHAMHVLCGHVRRLTAAPVSVRFGRRSERLRRRTDTEEAYTAGRGGCGLSASSRRTSRSCTHPVRRRAPGAASGSRHSRSVRRPWRAQWLDGRRGIPPDHLGCQRPLRECVRPCALLAVPVRSLCTRSTRPCACLCG
mmetsp:Transcript_26566/g.70875  ORF Transcript_26566/g.70875 Transcript_26566/m.70875 type:complete len:221 (+) Transcript_26566:330-992(+)